MLCSRDTVGVSMAVGTCAAKEQEAIGAASVHVDTKFRGHIAYTAHDDGERMPEEDLQ